MVDLALLQSVSYIAGALGVCVAAVYYATILKEQSRSRRITLTNNVVQQISSEAGVRSVIEQFQMRWKDIDDFRAKYDSGINLENSTIRHHYWLQMDTLGYLLKSGLVDREIIYISGGWMANTLNSMGETKTTNLITGPYRIVVFSFGDTGSSQITLSFDYSVLEDVLKHRTVIHYPNKMVTFWEWFTTNN